MEACRQGGAVSVGVAEDVLVQGGVGLEAYDKPEVGQVHPGRHLAAFVSGLRRQREFKQSLMRARDYNSKHILLLSGSDFYTPLKILNACTYKEAIISC